MTAKKPYIPRDEKMSPKVLAQLLQLDLLAEEVDCASGFLQRLPESLQPQGQKYAAQLRDSFSKFAALLVKR